MPLQSKAAQYTCDFCERSTTFPDLKTARTNGWDVRFNDPEVVRCPDHEDVFLKHQKNVTDWEAAKYEAFSKMSIEAAMALNERKLRWLKEHNPPSRPGRCGLCRRPSGVKGCVTFGGRSHPCPVCSDGP